MSECFHQMPTVIGSGLAVLVVFHYDKGSPPVLYPVDRADPGEPPEVTIRSVEARQAGKWFDVMDDLSESTRDALRLQALQYIRDLGEEYRARAFP